MHASMTAAVKYSLNFWRFFSDSDRSAPHALVIHEDDGQVRPPFGGKRPRGHQQEEKDVAYAVAYKTE